MVTAMTGDDLTAIASDLAAPSNSFRMATAGSPGGSFQNSPEQKLSRAHFARGSPRMNSTDIVMYYTISLTGFLGCFSALPPP